MSNYYKLIFLFTRTLTNRSLLLIHSARTDVSPPWIFLWRSMSIYCVSHSQDNQQHARESFDVLLFFFPHRFVLLDCDHIFWSTPLCRLGVANSPVSCWTIIPSYYWLYHWTDRSRRSTVVSRILHQTCDEGITQCRQTPSYARTCVITG